MERKMKTVTGQGKACYEAMILLLVSSAVFIFPASADMLGDAEEWSVASSGANHHLSVSSATSPFPGLRLAYSLASATEESWVSALRGFPETRDFSKDEGFRLRVLGDGSRVDLHIDLAGADNSDFLRKTVNVDWEPPREVWIGQQDFLTYGAATLRDIRALRLTLDANVETQGSEGTIVITDWSAFRRPEGYTPPPAIEFTVIGHEPVPRNYLYVTDRSMGPLPCRHQYVTPTKLRVFPLSDEPVLLHAFWKAPHLGFVMAYADNGGQGFTPSSEIHCLNVCMAETKTRQLVERFSRWSTDGYTFSEDLTAEMAEIQAAWERIRSLEPADRVTAASEADDITGLAGCALEKLEIEKAGTDIDRFGRREMEVVLQSRSGGTVGGRTISVRQIQRDFLMGAHPLQEVLGAMEKSEYIRETAPATFNLGILSVHRPLFCEPSELPAAVEQAWQENQNLLSLHQQLGLVSRGTICPWFTRKFGPWSGVLSFDVMCARLGRAVAETARRFRDSTDLWLVINEAHDWANAPGFSHSQLVEVTRAVVNGAHEGDPGSRTIVNACLPWGIYVHWREDETQWTPYEYFEALNRAGVRYDIVGLQLYTGFDPTFPLRDLADMSSMLDRYATLGKPIYITEMCSPSQGTSWGSWHGDTWNEDLQADYVEGLYTLAHGKPFVEAIRWFSFSDRQFKHDTGLVDRTLARPKPAYKRLVELARSWTTTAEGTTGTDGVFRFHGYLGDYELAVAGDHVPPVTRTVRLLRGSGPQRVTIEVE
jgi:GH35 family endo-1,4-beta-xylanase